MSAAQNRFLSTCAFRTSPEDPESGRGGRPAARPPVGLGQVSMPSVRVRRVASVDTHRGRDTRLTIAGGRCTSVGELRECWHSAPQGSYRLRSGLDRPDELSFVPAASAAGSGVEIFGAVHGAREVCGELLRSSPLPHLVAEPHFCAFALGSAEILLIDFPRMDALIEVTGSPADVDRAIGALGLPLSLFGHATLPELVSRFEVQNSLTALLRATDGQR